MAQGLRTIWIMFILQTKWGDSKIQLQHHLEETKQHLLKTGNVLPHKIQKFSMIRLLNWSLEQMFERIIQDIDHF